MTWHVHAIGAPIERGTVYHSASEAQDARADGQTITVLLNDREQRIWTYRELARLSDGTYQPAPFELVSNAPKTHFPHLSRAREGMIAFTANPLRGHLDRHEVMTPCRYLQTFCPGVDEAGRETICGEVRAALGATLHYAKTADEIERVYNARTGWTSCMAGQYQSSAGTWVQRWDTGGITGDRRAPSPVRAYGESDLEVLWIGTLGTTPVQDTVVARAVVWPERKCYTRLYGDTPRLQALLDADGWTQVRSLDGAQIQRIVLPNRELSVPYIDGTSRAEADETGHWLRLGGGNVDTSSQSGQVGDGARATCCRHYCDRDADAEGNDEGLCEHCYDARCRCTGCDEMYDDSEAGTYARSGDFYCDCCYDEHEFTCLCCDEPCQPLALRETLDNEVLCADCQDAQRCDGCGTWTRSEMTDDQCEDCAQTAALEALTTAAQTAADAGATAEQIALAVAR